MTTVTILTKELVEQFEFVVGRRVTAVEYMELRKQAMDELNAGYSVSISTQCELNLVHSNSNAINHAKSAITSTTTFPNLSPAAGNANVAANNPDVSAPVLIPEKPTSASNQVTAINPTPAPCGVQVPRRDLVMNELSETDDFFKLVNKFM